ncbi:hypothetical protein DXG03_006695 [Asterophora parasitica]|uniref:F-box domain-containing protein n=1 Tax=Asterophora parasitica TaxID=117018 RepID=A0A9P7G162_9AGAR|nr:hypothetical protein DXG03_006695 [Asterophora parasitica]
MLIHKKHLEVRDKVLSDAGFRNELILSHRELETSKALLCDYEAALVEIDRQIAPFLVRRARIEERLQTFRIAVAPHKQIPVELLSKIFAHCDSEADPFHIDDRRPIPLNTLYPWALGQVCSLWRCVSRTDSGLWRNITVKADTSSEHLFELLPPCASATLVIRDSAYSVTSARNIIPQVRVLDIDMGTMDIKSLFDYLPADILGDLEDLHIYLTRDSIYHSSMVLPNLLPSMGSLRSLKLGFAANVIPQAFSLNFPWDQIVSLDISRVYAVDVVAMSNYIQKFKSLKSLIITLMDHDEATLAIADGWLIMQAFRTLPQSLCSLTIEARYGDFSSKSMHLVLEHMQPEAWARLLFLDLTAAETAKGAMIKQILRHCVQLVRFCSVIPHDRESSIDHRVRDIALPHLTSLRLVRIEPEDFWIFQCLRVPLLKNIVLENLHPYKDWNLYISTVHEMITSSGRTVHAWAETGDRFTKRVDVVVV